MNPTTTPPDSSSSRRRNKRRHRPAHVETADSGPVDRQRQSEVVFWKNGDLILAPLRVANTLFNEGPWKNRLRAKMLGYRNGLPRELMVRSGETVVQVGMWRARNLVRLSKCVGSRGKVILIEADKRVVESLAPLVASQRLSNITIVNKAAFNTNGRRPFCVGTSPAFNRVDGTGVQMLHEVNRQAFETRQEIDVATVDSILASCGADRVDYMEISVNGIELQVLQGMEETLPATQRLFLSGYARTSDEHEPTNRKTEAYLRQHGFQTCLSCRSRATQEHFDPLAVEKWGELEANVFAWRE